MHPYPSIPSLTAAPDGLLADGHLWVLENIDGAPLRFQLRETGAIRFGDRDRVYTDPDRIPEPYGHAIRYVRERLDRTALQEAVRSVEDVTFIGVATQRQTIEYDWGRTPSVLGFDIWSASAGGFLPPDAVEGIFTELGLDPVHVVDREVRARDFDPATASIPDSAYYNGPAAGIVIRDKTGHRAVVSHPELRDSDATDTGVSAAAITADTTPDTAGGDRLDADAAAERYVTRARFETVAAEIESAGQPVTFGALYDRVLEALAREQPHQLYREPRTVDLDAFRAIVAARTRRFLDTR